MNTDNKSLLDLLILQTWVIYGLIRKVIRFVSSAVKRAIRFFFREQKNSGPKPHAAK